jgi:hypothetical protein
MRKPEAAEQRIFLNMSYDTTIWEKIRALVEHKTRTLVSDIQGEISRDRSLRELQGLYPVPWQLQEVMQQRVDSWVRRMYDACCEVYRATARNCRQNLIELSGLITWNLSS